MSAKERKDTGRGKSSKRTSVSEKLSNAGNEKKENAERKETITTSDEMCLSEPSPQMSSDNSSFGSEIEGKAELSAVQPCTSGHNSQLDAGCTSGCKDSGKETDHLNKLPITGYICDTSPVKPSKNNYAYFNFKFQTANGFCDGVCFEKSLHDQVKKIEETQKSVRLSKYSLKRSLYDTTDQSILLHKRSKIENIPQCTFEYKPPVRQVTKICEIKDISDFTLVSIIGKVHITSEQCQVKVQQHFVMKLDCKIADDTSAIKLTLWDNHIPLVEEGKVYEIINARVRSYGRDKYLSTNFETIVKEKSDQQNMIVVPELMEQESTSDKTIVVNQIGGVQEIQRFAVCNSCHRKLGNLQSELCVCDFCGLNQVKTVADQTHFSVGVFLSEENIHVRILKEQVESFLKLYNEKAESYNKFNVETATDLQITEAFLAARGLKITFNTKNNLVSAIFYTA
ncbi:uncharacterized protein LOC144649967 isoform X1 [Oculina patagonica]